MNAKAFPRSANNIARCIVYLNLTNLSNSELYKPKKMVQIWNVVIPALLLKKNNLHVTWDKWHLTSDMWHLTWQNLPIHLFLMFYFISKSTYFLLKLNFNCKLPNLRRVSSTSGIILRQKWSSGVFFRRSVVWSDWDAR